MRKKNLKLISIAGATAAFTAVFCAMAFSSIPNSTATIKATDFQAGRIIDDEVFYNSNTMTVSQIQEHLDKYSPDCDMWGEKAIGSGRYINGKAVNANTTRANYAKMVRENGNTNYHEPPYVCVNKYYENPTTHETLYETNGEVKEGMVSAAQIIYDSAKEYGINPQVLLVLLKKESYVWGDSWPLKWEYNTVMGYACPDGAPCDEKYFGFYNQVKTAAWQLKYYKEHINSYNYHPYKTNSILYSPDRSCGRKSVYLENIATTSLYIYTPYTPNDAALANYPGTSTCGSYGNRNFFMYFAEWFGSPLVDKTAQNNDNEMAVREDPIGAKIMSAYDNLADASKNFGNLISSKVSSDGQGFYWLQFKNGFLVGTEKTGFYESRGAIRNTWGQNGYQLGKFGYPLENISRHEATKTYWQRYSNGFIFCSDKYGCYESLYGPIRNAWAKGGYQAGTFGSPVSNVAYEQSTNLYWQQYEKGYIVGNEKIGYIESRGQNREVWGQNGFERGKFGYPLENIVRHEATKTYWQRYSNGFIFCSDKYGCYESLYGKIRNAWAKTGYQSGTLGSPVSNVIFEQSSKVYWQQYEKGYIVGTDETGYFESRGPIREVWGQNGFERGRLGVPTSNIVYNASAGTHTQTYAGGQISYNERTGKTTASFKNGR